MTDDTSECWRSIHKTKDITKDNEEQLNAGLLVINVKPTIFLMLYMNITMIYKLHKITWFSNLKWKLLHIMSRSLFLNFSMQSRIQANVYLQLTTKYKFPPYLLFLRPTELSYLYICMYVHIYACMHACMYVCICTQIHLFCAGYESYCSNRRPTTNVSTF